MQIKVLPFTNLVSNSLGGLTREFFTLISSELFDPNKGLFKLSGNGLSIQPAPDSMIVPNDLKLFELAGIVVAKVSFLTSCSL